MASINLATKYETKLDERYRNGSYTDKWCGTNYNWDGANSIKVWTVLAGELNDYNAEATANRFGTPSEVDDEMNVYTLTKKRSFAKTFDITNVQDQMFVKSANSYLKQMWDERYIPEIDKYRLMSWANGAGLGVVNSAQLTSTNIMEAILGAHAALDDADVPAENRVTFIRSDIAMQCKLAPELASNQNWTDKTIVKGKIAEINGSAVVSVSKSRMPAGVEFIVKYKNATADPVKLRMLRANDSAPGYAGTLMEGLCRYDSFVLAQKADGIFVYAESGMCEAPTIVVGSSKAVAISCGTSGADVRYTDDGTNPKTSATAKVYSGGFVSQAGKRIRAYACKEGMLNSTISSKDV